MPRIDLWAGETSYEEESHSPATKIEIMEGSSIHNHLDRGQNLTEDSSAEFAQDPIPKASHLWSSFIEQVESICVSTSLIILATSEIPYPLLPHGIRQFFESDTLNCSLSAPLKDAVPRFSVLVGRNFDCDMVIDLSAAKLSKDLVKYYFQLIYCKAHINEGSDTESKASDTVRMDANLACQNCEPGLATHPAGLPNPIVRDSLPSVTKNIKGKSSLMLAILTFGYQILLYPHFAELCWATSKLNEGPCADISGPWKGWPFNSCIVRPKGDSLEKEQLAVACSSANTKSNTKSGVVRGLIAVGLLAYRGTYTSLKEVAAEVRNVLELLALQVNAKIENENDRYKYGRLLSQVAYLEDLVNSWAYMLRSLEVHGQVTESDPRLACVGSHDNVKTYEDDRVQGDNGDKHVTENSLHEQESQCPVKLSATNSISAPLNEDVSVQLIGEVAVSTIQEPLHQTYLHFQNHKDANVSVLNGDDVNTQSHVLKSSESDMKVNEVLRPISNGYTPTGCVVLPRDGPCASGDMDCVKRVDGEKDSNQDDDVLFSDEIHMPSAEGNKFSCRENLQENIDAGCTLNITNSDPDLLCLYRCCSKCLVMLQQLVRKDLYYQRGLRGSQWTVEDLHDCVKSSSMHLHSEIRKFCLGESSTSSLGENIKHYNHIDLVKVQQTKVCGNSNSGRKVIGPVECTSHPRMKSSTEAASVLSPRELELDLIYKDGVVISVDPKKDVSWHCKFESICLCSLLEWLVMTRQPSD